MSWTAYGQAKWLQTWLEEQGVSCVMAIRRSDTLTMAAGEQRADELIAAVPARAWQKIPAGAGAHGPREYHWARVAVRPGWGRGRGHWRAWYAHVTLSMPALAWLAAARAQAQAAKGEPGPAIRA